MTTRYRAVELSNGKFALESEITPDNWKLMDAVTWPTEQEAVQMRDRLNEVLVVVRVIP